MEMYHDVAIPIAWPDQTARGDEKWMSFFKRIGIVKNLNFRVGHAAILLANKKTGQIRYFDFGRYITPRGLGRARSVNSDPRLKLHTKAEINEAGDLLNLEAILIEMSGIEDATHGGGRLLCSISKHISYEKGVAFAEQLVNEGPILYGALAAGNNSCSRYVAQILTASMPKSDKRTNRILYPEFIKASPTSNVVNATHIPTVYCYYEGVMESWNMNRKDSLIFQLKLLKDNFTTSGAKKLGDDQVIGHTQSPSRHESIPKHAQWLGGIGEGRWFALTPSESTYKIARYKADGTCEYQVFCSPLSDFDPKIPYTFTFQIHHQKHILVQGTKRVVFQTQTTDIVSTKIFI